ncbi:MAG: hypothetical protein ACP5UZ_07845 [Thermoplasmata archaeon]
MVDVEGDDKELDEETKNIIEKIEYPPETKKVIARRIGLEEGKSGAQVWRVIHEGDPKDYPTYIVKVGDKNVITKEFNSYIKFVEGKLPCAVQPELIEGNQKSGLLETMLDSQSGYKGLSNAFENCKTSEDVKELLQPIFDCLEKWYGSNNPIDKSVDIAHLFDDVRKYQKEWKDKYGEYRMVNLQGSELEEDPCFSILNPNEMLNVPKEHLYFKFAPCHGDLRTANIFVKEGEGGVEAKIIDFGQTEEGIILRDLVKLETSVKFELLDLDLKKFYELERLLCTQDSYDEIELTDTRIEKETKLSLVFKAVELIRAEAKKYSVGSFKDYQYLLLLQSLKYMGYKLAKPGPINRAHVSAHLLTKVLNPSVAAQIMPDIYVSLGQPTDHSDPFYSKSLKLMKGYKGTLTLVQRTPSLLFKTEGEEEKFAKELWKFIERCKNKDLHFNYIFPAIETGKKYNALNEKEKIEFEDRLKKLKNSEENSKRNGDHHFRIECLSDDRKVFSPMILTNKESVIFLAEDTSDVRSRKAVSMNISNSGRIEELHETITKISVKPEPQSYDSILDLIKKSGHSELRYEISEKEDAMYTLGKRIAENSKKRLIIIQRTPSLILGAEPLEEGQDNKYKHDMEFINVLMDIAKKASESQTLSFSYLWSAEMTRDRLKQIKDKDNIFEGLKNDINKNLKVLTTLEQGSYKDGHYTFRIGTFQSKFLGPLALGDMTVAFLFAQTENKALALKIESDEISNSIYEIIKREIDTPKKWKYFADMMGTL